MAYDPATASAVLRHMSEEGLSLRKACIKVGIPPSNFRFWVDQDEELAAQYARARDELIDYKLDEMFEGVLEPVGSTDNGATDSGAVAKQRLIYDARRWHLSKLAPKKYGDKLELSGDADAPLITKIERVIVQK